MYWIPDNHSDALMVSGMTPGGAYYLITLFAAHPPLLNRRGILQGARVDFFYPNVNVNISKPSEGISSSMVRSLYSVDSNRG